MKRRDFVKRVALSGMAIAASDLVGDLIAQSPQGKPLESTFKGLCPYASQLVVYGADRNFVSALVTLDPEAIAGWGAQHGMAGQGYAEIVRSDACREMVQGYVDQLNAGLNRWETIKKFTILENDLTVEDGELTPSLKLKRKVVSEKYREQLDAHYTS